MSESVDYLEVDNPIPGQNYVCLSFVSPEKTLNERELFLFNKFINQRCGEWELKLDEIVKDVSDDYKNKINAEIKEVLRTEMKFTLDEFKSKFEDFKYKYGLTCYEPCRPGEVFNNSTKECEGNNYTNI